MVKGHCIIKLFFQFKITHPLTFDIINASYLLRDVKVDTKKDESNYTSIKGIFFFFFFKFKQTHFFLFFKL